MAVGRHFRRDNSNQHRVVIGKDTRLSSYMIENALTAGLTAVGMNVHLLGPTPTPAVGLLTKSMRADLGVMISASHNQFEDNGIKFFGPDGYKLSAEQEKLVEKSIDADAKLVSPSEIGSVTRIDGGLGRYVEFAKTTFPKSLRLNRLRIVLDCANGAAYRAAPDLFWELGAEVVPVAVSPNGTNINLQCGATDTRQAARRIHETRSDIGICLDGDADRVVLIDENGKTACGDQILALLAGRLQSKAQLKHNTVVATVMSNFAFEQHLQSMGIALQRTNVGDRCVVTEMLRGDFSLGGEQSGHVIMTEHSTTGDGLITALQVLAILVEEGKSASEVLNVFTPMPQVLKNVQFVGPRSPLENPDVRQVIDGYEAELSRCGRVFARKSGTEPVIRVMVEGPDVEGITRIVDDICKTISSSCT